MGIAPNARTGSLYLARVIVDDTPAFLEFAKNERELAARIVLLTLE